MEIIIIFGIYQRIGDQISMEIIKNIKFRKNLEKISKKCSKNFIKKFSKNFIKKKKKKRQNFRDIDKKKFLRKYVYDTPFGSELNSEPGKHCV